MVIEKEHLLQRQVLLRRDSRGTVYPGPVESLIVEATSKCEKGIKTPFADVVTKIEGFIRGTSHPVIVRS